MANKIQSTITAGWFAQSMTKTTPCKGSEGTWQLSILISGSLQTLLGYTQLC